MEENVDQNYIKHKKMLGLKNTFVHSTLRSTKDRVAIMKNEFKEFVNLEEGHIRKLIKIFDYNVKSKYVASDIPIAIVGGLLLWAGWLFFNASSGYEIVNTSRQAMPTSIVLRTFCAPAASAIVFLLLEMTSYQLKNTQHFHNPCRLINAILAGLVAVTASCNNVELWASAVIGMIGCIIYLISDKILKRMQIDDPIEASQIHGFCGYWGCLAVGVFD